MSALKRVFSSVAGVTAALGVAGLAAFFIFSTMYRSYFLTFLHTAGLSLVLCVLVVGLGIAAFTASKAVSAARYNAPREPSRYDYYGRDGAFGKAQEEAATAAKAAKAAAAKAGRTAKAT